MIDSKEKAKARKRASRERMQQAGIKKFELNLDTQEIGMLRKNCAARRPGRDPYDMDEYITMLIRQDNSSLQCKLKELSVEKCAKCNDNLPQNSCRCQGDEQCWVTNGWHEVKLVI